MNKTSQIRAAHAVQAATTPNAASTCESTQPAKQTSATYKAKIATEAIDIGAFIRTELRKGSCEPRGLALRQ